MCQGPTLYPIHVQLSMLNVIPLLNIVAPYLTYQGLQYLYINTDGALYNILYLRNRKHFLCFHTVIETRVKVWEDEKLKSEHEPVGREFPRNLKFFQTSTSVSITYENTGKMVSIF